MKKTILALSLLVGMSSTASVFAALPQSIRIGTDATYAPFFVERRERGLCWF
ncbi:lysine/arginine/ornithine ABC transporter substrate-binding periplasmic protein [Klebsiella pneumoniae]|uniref:Lysine/arginine/ornithine ABC transporter substrate-binding periplasmic protein n=1 Tax=Klebsiella pneumoniae TaxID=573 RepID=A0A377XPY1_KLEPN|nr:lysine/arginine/ornithine ABC transporter substrate-binding periplasmic protein [Klebsiella pneumoniae]